jgi:exosortase
VTTISTDPSGLTNSGTVAEAPPSSRYGPAEGGTSEQLPKGWLDVPIRAWVILLSLSVVFVLLYWTSLHRLWLKTNPINGVAEWAHAVFVPVIGAYYLLMHLDELLKTHVKPLLGLDIYPWRFISAGLTFVGGLILWKVLPTLPGPFTTYSGEIGTLGQGLTYFAAFVLVFDWGIGTLLAGLATYAYGIYPGSNDFVKDIGMVMTVFGTVLAIGGWGIMRIAWFPCVFLICALPWPGLFYSKAAMPMQELAANVAVGVMQLLGVSVENSGTQIVINRPGLDPRILNVAEACAGLKGLMTFVTMGAAVGFLSSRPLWQKIFITLSAVPIAIACNSLRVSGQGILDYYWGEQWSSGFAHQFAGIVLLLPGFLALLGVVWVLDKMFVDADDTIEPQTVKAGGAA